MASIAGTVARIPVGAVRAIAANVLRATEGRDVLFNSPDGWEVEYPGLWFLGSGIGNGGKYIPGSGQTIGNPIPGASGSASGGIPAVARSTSLIVDTLAGLPWDVYRGREKLPTPDWISDPQALRLDGRAIGSDPGDVRMSNVDFWAQWLTSALWFGDGYLWTPFRANDGAPKPPLFVLNPADVDIRNGGVAGQAGDYYVGETRLRADEIIHLRGLAPIKGGHGSGVMTRFAEPLDFVSTIRSYARSIFNSGVPAGYLKSGQPNMTQEKADQLKAKWLENHGGSKRSIAVLNATTEFHPLTFSPVDTELIEAFRYSLQEIALMFGVPAYMLGAPTDGNTYANIESRMIEFVRFTLMPWARRAEATLDAQFPRGTSLKIGLDGLMRADTKTRLEAYKVATEIGLYNRNELRELEDLPPLPEGGENENDDNNVPDGNSANLGTGSGRNLRAMG